MRILLTGSTGFVGTHLAAALLEQGFTLVCAVRKARASDHPRRSYIEADFAQDTGKGVWLARLSGIDIVINTVGIIRETAAQTFTTLHTETPRALFAACAESQVQMVIQLSALGADEDATSRYHLSKKAADDYLASLPLRSCIVQPSLIYGPDGASARLFKMLASMPFVMRFGSAPQLVQPIWIDDVVSAIVGLIRHAAVVRTLRVPLAGPQALPFVDYLAALRRAMGMGTQRVLALPGPLARLAARVAGALPGSVFDAETLQMLERGNVADAAIAEALINRPLRPVSEFITAPAAERVEAKLGWLLPILRLSIALVWIFTAIVSFGIYPVEASYQLLQRTGIPAALAPLMLYGAAAFDLALGLAILLLPKRRWLWLAQSVLIVFYSVLIAWKLPEFLWHPYGPLSKNLPMLAAIWLLYELEER